MLKEQSGNAGKNSTCQELNTGELYSVYFRRKVVDDQYVQRKKKSAYQYEQISFSNGKSICDAQEIKSDQSHCNGSPDKFRAFFAKEQSDDRDDYNITGSDKAGFSDGCILDAKLLEIACQTEADTAGDTADNQSFFSCILDTVLLEVSDLPDALEAESEGEFLFFRIKISGIRTTAPIRERTALKVKPPTYFIPTL